MKKLLVILLVLAVATAAFAGGRGESGAASGSGLIKIGIVNLHPSESGYREANVRDMDDVFTIANGYLALKTNVNTLAEQLQAARQYITEDVQYLLISAADANGWDDVLRDAQRAGVKVFLFDRMINTDGSLFEAAVVSDMESQGKTAVEWLKRQNLPVYNIIQIHGQMGSAAQSGRAAPLDAEIAANPNWNLVRSGTGGDTWSQDEARRIVEAAIAAGERFNVVYAHNDGMAEGAMQALQAAGRSHGVNGDVMIMGFDFNRFALRYVQSGQWNYDGQSSPFQAETIHGFIQKLEKGEKLSGFTTQSFFGKTFNNIIILDETYFANPDKIPTDADIQRVGLGN